MDTKRLVNDEGVTDHTALLPTKKKSLVDFDKYTDKEKKILELLYQNLEEATSKPYKYEKTCITLSYGGELFTVTGVRNLELGWKKNRPDETKEQLLPVFQKGEKVAIDNIFIEKRQSEPPERFTDGKLLQAMEEAGQSLTESNDSCVGIGTPATRAETIEKLVSDGFVERVGEVDKLQYFVPTELADLLYSVLPDSLKSADLTAEWETKLSEVEKGTLEPADFLRQIKEFITKTLKAERQTKLINEGGDGMLLLNVPYGDKDEAKKLGARWNPELKKWYVQKREDYPKFAKWILTQGSIVACDAIYVLEGKQNCFKCGKETRVIGFALENFFEFEGDPYDEEGVEYTYWSDVIRIVGPIDPIPDPILKYLQSKYNYKDRYSSTTGESHINNCCDNCDVLQGDFYLFHEVNSPFFIDSEEKVKDLKIYRINLKHDIIINASVSISSTDEMIKQYGRYSLLNIDV